MRIRAAIAAGLTLLTFALFSPVRDHDFTSYDDRAFVVDNPLVRDGLSVEAMKRAFTTPYMGNWTPLSTISLQIERSLFGADAGKMLLVNAALHALATALLFLAFAAMTGEVWPSAFVAAVFGFHPLHVESVAWASERRDVLSAVFWMLALLAHARYARAPSARRRAMVFGAVALGLLAKSMLVTLPLVLLLLDYWPLRRMARADGSPWPDRTRLGRVALEKLPLLLLAAVSAAVTLKSQAQDRAVYPTHILTLDLRVLNALVSYASYLRDAVWPAALGPFYLHPLGEVSRAAAAASAALIALLSGVCLRFARERPWLIVGWLWYLGTLVPVIGLVQVGMQARADRYTYLPLIGVSLMLAWSGRELARRLPAALVAVAFAAACAAMALATSRQIPHWRSSEALFRRALAVTDTHNFVAEQGLGFALLADDRPAEAVVHFERAAQLQPGQARPRVGLANALHEAGRSAEAIPAYEEALALAPEDVVARGNLGIVLALEGRLAEAEPHLLRALAQHAEAGTDPGAIPRHLGDVSAARGDAADALAYYETALARAPGDVNLLARAGLQAEQAGRPERAVTHYREAVRREPRFVDAANNLAWLLATCQEPDVRAPQEALERVEGAIARGAAGAGVLDTRAAALAAADRFEEAAALARRAAQAAEAAGEAELAADARAHASTFAARRALARPCRKNGS